MNPDALADRSTAALRRGSCAPVRPAPSRAALPGIGAVPGAKPCVPKALLPVRPPARRQPRVIRTAPRVNSASETVPRWHLKPLIEYLLPLTGGLQRLPLVVPVLPACAGDGRPDCERRDESTPLPVDAHASGQVARQERVQNVGYDGVGQSVHSVWNHCHSVAVCQMMPHLCDIRPVGQS